MQDLMVRRSVLLGDFLKTQPAVPRTLQDIAALSSLVSASISHSGGDGAKVDTTRGTNPILDRFVPVRPAICQEDILLFAKGLVSKVVDFEVRLSIQSPPHWCDLGSWFKVAQPARLL